MLSRRVPPLIFLVAALAAASFVVAGCEYSKVYAPNGQLLEHRIAFLYNPQSSHITMDIDGDLGDAVSLISRDAPDGWSHVTSNTLEARGANSLHRMSARGDGSGWNYRYQFTPGR